jgi:hypothetical protein
VPLHPQQQQQQITWQQKKTIGMLHSPCLHKGLPVTGTGPARIFMAMSDLGCTMRIELSIAKCCDLVRC